VCHLAKGERQVKSSAKSDKSGVRQELQGLKEVENENSQRSSMKLHPQLLVKIHDLMVKARCVEERLIKMYKQNDGYFWIGGPGEEAFSVPLGLQIKKGEGPDYDYLHLHYRSSPILTAMGMDPLGAFRLMKNTINDPHSGGRNFANHYSIRKWNVAPISSTIETQYLHAIGTAIAQKHHGGTGLTFVNGGDAGTAEGDFASCLIWSSRPGQELPMLIIVTNNGWGISTEACTQHGEKQIADRPRTFGIKTKVINGNDPVESYLAIQEAMEYIRTERKPCFIEARVSRLYGHSSATGANMIGGEQDCLAEFEKRLEKEGILTRDKMDTIRKAYEAEFLELAKKVREEPLPDPATLYDFVYSGQKGKYW
jgi:2-oxoisovalerate dehydrogenase E1 component alpha subunit